MRPRAFTLVELVLVISLTLILSAGALIGLRGTQNWRAAAAVRRLQADFTYARSAALLSGRRTLCAFDAGNGAYEIQQEASPGSGAITGVTLTHPATGQPWRVVLANLASGLQVDVSPATSRAFFGFEVTGMPVDSSGAALTRDLVLTCRPGGVLTLRAGSGLCEVSWP